MSAIAVKGYECPTCGTFYRRQEDAAECCPPGDVDGFECSVCRAFYNLKADAEGCCGHADCWCGCPKRWHYVLAPSFCLSPDCGCRKYERASLEVLL